MGNMNKTALKLGFWSVIIVAISIIVFMLTLVLTFTPNFTSWDGIEIYSLNFKPIQMFTVFPSIVMACAYVVFTVAIHYYAQEDKKIFSHLSITFGLMYAIISVANYLIQIITVIPSIEKQYLNGLDILVAGYPNSIFFALMASYFFMCVSALFISLVFNNEKGQKSIKILLLSSVCSIPICLLCIILDINVIMPFAGIIWFVCFVMGLIKVAILFRNYSKQDKI
jgi:hypothetical protein